MFEVYSTSHAYLPACALVGHLAKRVKADQVVDHPSHVHVHVPAFGESARFKWRGRQASATRERVDGVVGLNTSVAQMERVVVEGVAGGKEASDFLADAEAHWDALGRDPKHIRVFAADYNNYGQSWNFEHLLPRRSLRTVYHPKEIKEGLRDSLKRFRESEEDYRRQGLPYKHVALLHGPPGTGKTSLIFALVSDMDFENAYVLSFSSSMKDSNFVGLVHSMKPNSVLIMEDADTMVVNRKEQKGINFSTMLNVLDGPLRPHGLVCFLTTNHIEAFDAAMLRSGRMDVVLHVAAMDRATMTRMAEDLLRDLHPRLPKGACAERVAALTTNPAAVSSFLFEKRGAFDTCDELMAGLRDFVKVQGDRVGWSGREGGTEGATEGTGKGQN